MSDMTKLRKKTNSELEKDILDIRQKIVEKRKGVILGEVTNNHEVNNLRKELARVMTVLNEDRGETNV